jgi:hypothetical protein
MGAYWDSSQLFLNTKIAYDLVGKEMLRNILLEFYILMKLLRLIKTC